MDVHRLIPADGHLSEQALDLLRDPGDDRIVEDEGQGRQQQGAQHNGDDDFDRIRDVEIAALVGERHTGPKSETVRFAADAAGKLLHGNTSCKCDIGFWYWYGYGRSGPADRLEQAVFVGAGPVRIRFRLLAQKPPEPAPPPAFTVRRNILFLRHGFLLFRR